VITVILNQAVQQDDRRVILVGSGMETTRDEVTRWMGEARNPTEEPMPVNFDVRVVRASDDVFNRNDPTWYTPVTTALSTHQETPYNHLVILPLKGGGDASLRARNVISWLKELSVGRATAFFEGDSFEIYPPTTPMPPSLIAGTSVGPYLDRDDIVYLLKVPVEQRRVVLVAGGDATTWDRLAANIRAWRPPNHDGPDIPLHMGPQLFADNAFAGSQTMLEQIYDQLRRFTQENQRLFNLIAIAPLQLPANSATDRAQDLYYRLRALGDARGEPVFTEQPVIRAYTVPGPTGNMVAGMAPGMHDVLFFEAVEGLDTAMRPRTVAVLHAPTTAMTGISPLGNFLRRELEIVGIVATRDVMVKLDSKIGAGRRAVRIIAGEVNPGGADIDEFIEVFRSTPPPGVLTTARVEEMFGNAAIVDSTYDDLPAAVRAVVDQMSPTPDDVLVIIG
jgi:hypothetical protein